MTNNLFLNFIIIFLGTFTGSSIRFLILAKFTYIKISYRKRLIFINSCAAFVLGLFLNLFQNINVEDHNQKGLIFLITFLGGLSTFSTFIYELFKLSSKSKFKKCIELILSSITLALICISLGFFISKV